MEGDLARHKRISHKPTPDWRGGAAVAVAGELVEPQAMEAKAGTPQSGVK